MKKALALGISYYISSSTGFVLSSLLQASITEAPNLANLIAECLPIPVLAPVTMTTYPSRLGLCLHIGPLKKNLANLYRIIAPNIINAYLYCSQRQKNDIGYSGTRRNVGI